jgi:hypothetical protein
MSQIKSWAMYLMTAVCVPHRGGFTLRSPWHVDRYLCTNSLAAAVNTAATIRHGKEHLWAYRLGAAVVQYLAISRPRAAMDHLSDIGRTYRVLDLRTFIITAGGDTSQLFSLVNGLHASGVYQDIHIYLDKGDEARWSGVQSMLAEFEEVQCHRLGTALGGNQHAVKHQSSLISQLWGVVDSVSTTSSSKPLLLLGKDAHPTSFFAIQLAGIVRRLEKLQLSPSYILDLTAQYWLRDGQVIAPGVSVCPRSEMVSDTEALFIPARVAMKLANWFQQMRSGHKSAMKSLDIEVTSLFKDFLRAHPNIKVLGTTTALVQHVCLTVDEDGDCWQDKAFQANSRTFVGLSAATRGERLKIRVSSKLG